LYVNNKGIREYKGKTELIKPGAQKTIPDRLFQKGLFCWLLRLSRQLMEIMLNRGIFKRQSNKIEMVLLAWNSLRSN
jgi:hypothetical protein